MVFSLPCPLRAAGQHRPRGPAARSECSVSAAPRPAERTLRGSCAGNTGEVLLQDTSLPEPGFSASVAPGHLLPQLSSCVVVTTGHCLCPKPSLVSHCTRHPPPVLGPKRGHGRFSAAPALSVPGTPPGSAEGYKRMGESAPPQGVSHQVGRFRAPWKLRSWRKGSSNLVKDEQRSA